MNKWLQIVLGVSVLVVAVAFFYSLVILPNQKELSEVEVKSHNLNVMTQVRLCLDDDFGENTARSCIDHVKKEYIGEYPDIGENKWFDNVSDRTP